MVGDSRGAGGKISGRGINGGGGNISSGGRALSCLCV